jgi:GGDEF domain-containing protein
VKPFDNEELLARVAGVLRRADYMRSQSPLTGLPGNVRIEDEIQARHIGGDDFVVVCDPERAQGVAREVIARFDAVAPSLYDEEDRSRGGIDAEDRLGSVRLFPLLTISIGIASTAARPFAHRAEAVGIATDLKNFAKREPGSSYAMDRRRA